MRENNKIIQELESLAWSNGCITARVPKSVEKISAYYPADANPFAYAPSILLSQNDAKRKNFVAIVAHEIGHFLIEENCPPLIRDVISIAYRYDMKSTVLLVERRAWSMARYILCSLGHLNKKERKAFTASKKFALGQYKKYLKG